MSKKVNSLILVLIFMALTCTNAFAAPEFQTSANRDQKIETLQDEGYLHGYADGSLKLEDKIKRSEFATIVVYALEKQDLAKSLQGKSEPFTDVKKNYWANGIISVIKDEKGLKNNINIIAGYPDGTFKPENKISNAEAIKMLVCLKKSDLTKEMIDNAKWPTSWIAWAREEGIIGKNSNISEDLDYSAEALRGDVFTMFYNAFMDNNKKAFEESKLTVKSIPVIDVKDTDRGYRESHSYNPPFKYEEGRPWTPLTPAEPYIPLTPLEPAEPYIPLTPLEPAETVEEYTLKAGENLEGLTPAKDNGKYNEGTEISFTVKEEAGKTAKVEKIVDGKAEELTATDGKYSFTITADTEIKVTYEDIDYTLTVEDTEGGVANLTAAKENGKYNEGTEISFTVEKTGKIAKVEKVVDGATEELKATDGKYSFIITADTTIKVTYENIYELTAGEGVENLTEANADDKYKENTEISFTVKEVTGKTAKVEKIVDGKAEELTATDGKYSFTITADTEIKVTYEDIDYTLTVEDTEGGVANLTAAKENGKYNEGTEISFTVEKAGKIAKVEKVVDGATEELKATDGKYSFTITADTTIKVTYENIYELTAGEGVENLTEANADDKYKENTEISFTVKEVTGKTAKVEKVVDGVAEELKATDGKYSFTITADTEIKVTYEDIDYTLTVEDTEGGVANLTAAKENGKYNEGTEISFTVEKAGKIAKVEKVVDGATEELKATDGKYSFTITADTTIKVTYENIYELTAGEGVENLTEANADDKYKENTEISFTVKEVTGKTAKVEKVVDGVAEELKATDGKYSFTITADTEIKVTYEDIDYTLTVEDTEGGVANLTAAKENGKYNEGTEISFTVEKAGKIAKVEKVVDGATEELKVTDGKYSFTITADTTIKVTYENIYELTAGEGVENLTEANADDKYKENTEISFTVKEVTGKTAKVEKVVDGVAEELKATDGKYSFNITADTEIKVTYENIYTLTKEDPENGIENLTEANADDKYKENTKISFTVKEKAGKIAKVEKVVDGATEELKATDGKYSFNITADTKIKATYVQDPAGKKYDDAFVKMYKANPERIMNLYKNTRQPNQPNAILGAYDYSFDGDHFVFMINPEKKDTSIAGMRGTGLSDGLIGIFTSNKGGKPPQEFLVKVTLVEEGTGNKVELNKSDLDSFASRWGGLATMMNKGFPGMSVSSKLSDLAGKKFNITYEYQENGKTYIKERTLEFNYNYVEQ